VEHYGAESSDERDRVREGILVGSSSSEGCSFLSQSKANLHEVLSSSRGGTGVAMRLREDVLLLLRRKGSSSDRTVLKELDASLQDWLEAVFCVDALQFQRITFDTSSGETLEKVAKSDVVLSSVRSLRELKRRLHNGRRCFGLFHHSLPGEPLAFVHVALTSELAPSLRSLDAASEKSPPPTCAMFYSVNSPHASLSGLDLATRVIKLAAHEVKLHFPSIRLLSTLSPIPGFMSWLTSVCNDETAAAQLASCLPAAEESALRNAAAYASGVGNKQSAEWQAGDKLKALLWLQTQLQQKSWTASEPIAEALRGAVCWLGCRYLAHEKQKKTGLPIDPVARFHLRNGASLHRLNWLGNPSSKGLEASAGLMVNYLYDLPQLEARAALFEDKSEFHIGQAVENTLLLK